MKRIAITACAAVIAVAGGLGISQASNSSVAKTTASTQRGPGGTPGGGPGGGAGLSALAKDLDVSEAKLQKAMQSARPTAGGSPQDMAATLAKALNLSTATVQKALQANAPSGGTPPSGATGAPPTGATQS